MRRRSLRRRPREDHRIRRQNTQGERNETRVNRNFGSERYSDRTEAAWKDEFRDKLAICPDLKYRIEASRYALGQTSQFAIDLEDLGPEKDALVKDGSLCSPLQAAAFDLCKIENPYSQRPKLTVREAGEILFEFEVQKEEEYYYTARTCPYCDRREQLTVFCTVCKMACFHSAGEVVGHFSRYRRIGDLAHNESEERKILRTIRRKEKRQFAPPPRREL